MIRRPKDQGGLRIEVLEVKNKCLLSKWLFKLLNEEGVWQELLHNKYLIAIRFLKYNPNPLIDSPFWKGIMGVNDEFFSRGSFIIGDGSNLVFGKILGWVRGPCLLNTRCSITSCNIKMLLWRMFCQMLR